MILERVQKQIAESMKAKDEIRLSTLKMLLSAFEYKKIDLQHALSEEEELAVVRAEAKKRRDAIDLYKKGGAKDRAEKEQKELEILREFLPAEMSDDELEKIVSQVISETGANSMTDMGKVMGEVMQRISGKAEGGRVSQMVKQKLTS